jgi:nucleotide-binding universal stress UspA family protein
MDGSAGALRAFRYARKMLFMKSPEILLYNVLRNFDGIVAGTGRPVPMPEAEWARITREKVKRAEDEMKSRFAKCTMHLKQSGIDPIRVRSKIEIGVPSRAEAIVTKARQGGYDTVVMGRRGLSDVRQFSMGRVCQKVLQMATARAVWIVN